ncbi:MAG TPA: hypothetical protein VNY51_14620 [Candidatus Dormibacteraeota bacterium]|jgi:hypothetical protein|nr:hypothetical protein [Candidatus Dormibacteraeota bacterium]
MAKYWAAFVSAVAVTALTILPILVPPEQITWLRWRVGAVSGGLIAIVAIGIQFYMQYREEKRMRAEDEKRNRQRDKKIDELLRRVPKRRLTQDAAFGSGFSSIDMRKETLAERVEQLAHEYYDCLQEGITRSTYESRLKPKLLELLPELEKSQFKVNISKADIEAKQLYVGMRETADTLALTAVKMENPKMRLEGRYLVVDEDESH